MRLARENKAGLFLPPSAASLGLLHFELWDVFGVEGSDGFGHLVACWAMGLLTSASTLAQIGHRQRPVICKQYQPAALGSGVLAPQLSVQFVMGSAMRTSHHTQVHRLALHAVRGVTEPAGAQRGTGLGGTTLVALAQFDELFIGHRFLQSSTPSAATINARDPGSGTLRTGPPGKGNPTVGGDGSR